MSEPQDLESHPYCLMYPEWTDEEHREAIQSFEMIGQQSPILTFQGKIIDGKNRYQICKTLGVKPKIKEWKGKGNNLLEFVTALNFHRRNLSVSQRAMIGAEIKKEMEKQVASLCDTKQSKFGVQKTTKSRRSGDATKQAAKKVGVSRATVAAATRVKKASPELADQVKRGEKTLSEANKELGFSGGPISGLGNQPESVRNAILGQATAKSQELGGKCMINGVLSDDPPDIALKRAAGTIPPNEVPVIDDLDADPKDAVVAAKDDADHRQARADEISDEEWVASLPLSSILTGNCLRIFQDDAKAYRQLADPRAKFKWSVDRVVKPIRRRGAYVWEILFFMGRESPDRWILCPTTEMGGCGGCGQVVGIGVCSMCNGRGYCLGKRG